MKDVRVSRWFFFQHLHKLFGDIDAIKYLEPHDFSNRQILTYANMWLRQRNLSPPWHISIARCTNISYMRQLRKCSHVVTATFLVHDKVQKTDLKPLQLVKSEWSPPLQQLSVSSVSTKCLRMDSTKYSCVQFDVQFSTSVVNKLHCTFAWICVDFSWKTAFISYHVMSAKTLVLKACCLLFDSGLTALSFEKVRRF